MVFSSRNQQTTGLGRACKRLPKLPVKAPWDAPHDMNGYPIVISLQHQDARAFGIDWIFLYDNSLGDAGK
jgi:hypothetical protein